MSRIRLLKLPLLDFQAISVPRIPGSSRSGLSEDKTGFWRKAQIFEARQFAQSFLKPPLAGLLESESSLSLVFVRFFPRLDGHFRGHIR